MFRARSISGKKVIEDQNWKDWEGNGECIVEGEHCWQGVAKRGCLRTIIVHFMGIERPRGIKMAT
jgi:hypothetical protein